MCVQNITCSDLSLSANGYYIGNPGSIVADTVTADSVSVEASAAKIALSDITVSETIDVNAWGAKIACDGIDSKKFTVKATETEVFAKFDGEEKDFAIHTETTGSFSSNIKNRESDTGRDINISTTNAKIYVVFGDGKVFTFDGNKYVEGAYFGTDGNWNIYYFDLDGKERVVIGDERYIDYDCLLDEYYENKRKEDIYYDEHEYYDEYGDRYNVNGTPETVPNGLGFADIFKDDASIDTDDSKAIRPDRNTTVHPKDDSIEPASDSSD